MHTEPHQNDSRAANPKIFAFALSLILILSFILYSLIFYFRSMKNNVQGEVIAKRFKILEEVNQKQHQLISTYEWIDKDKGIVRIPIERAQFLILEDLNKPIQLK